MVSNNPELPEAATDTERISLKTRTLYSLGGLSLVGVFGAAGNEDLQAVALGAGVAFIYAGVGAHLIEHYRQSTYSSAEYEQVENREEPPLEGGL